MVRRGRGPATETAGRAPAMAAAAQKWRWLMRRGRLPAARAAACRTTSAQVRGLGRRVSMVLLKVLHGERPAGCGPACTAALCHAMLPHANHLCLRLPASFCPSFADEDDDDDEEYSGARRKSHDRRGGASSAAGRQRRKGAGNPGELAEGPQCCSDHPSAG